MRIAAAASVEWRSTRPRISAIASCACSGVAVRPVPIAQIGSYAITTSPRRSSGTSERSASIWRVRIPSVSSESRCDSFSPTQRIGCRPAPSATGTFRARASSLSAKCWRRSEWPRITPSTPSSTSIGAETSPVKAPSGSSCMFWAATRTGLRAQCSTAVFSDRKGGQTTTSGPDSGRRGRKSARKLSVSSRVLYIFQLAARSGVLMRQRLLTGQLDALHQLQRGAASGRDPVDRVREAEPVQCGDGVSTTDDGVTRGGGNRLRDGAGAGVEGRYLEGPHRPVPEDGPGAGEPLAEVGRGAGAHVEPRPARGHVDPVQRPRRGAGVELPAEDQVLRQLEDRVAALGLGEHPLGGLDPLLLDQRVSGVPPLGLEEAEAHRAADQDLLGEAEEAVDHAELVGHLGPAEDDDQRALRMVADGGELDHLPLQQQPGIAGQVVRDTLG